MECKSWLVLLYFIALVTFTELYIPWHTCHLWSCSGNGVTSSALCSVWTSPGWVRQWKHGRSILQATHSKYSFPLCYRTRRATLGTGIPVYLMIFILSQLFQVALAWDAVGSIVSTHIGLSHHLCFLRYGHRIPFKSLPCYSSTCAALSTAASSSNKCMMWWTNRTYACWSLVCWLSMLWWQVYVNWSTFILGPDCIRNLGKSSPLMHHYILIHALFHVVGRSTGPLVRTLKSEVSNQNRCRHVDLTSPLWPFYRYVSMVPDLVVYIKAGHVLLLGLLNPIPGVGSRDDWFGIPFDSGGPTCDMYLPVVGGLRRAPWIQVYGLSFLCGFGCWLCLL